MVGNVDNDAWIKCKWCTQSTAVCEHWWFARFIYKEYCSVSLLSGLLRRYCVVIFLVSCKPFVKPRTIWLLCNSYSFPVTFSLKYFIALGFWFRVVHCLVSLGNFKTKIQTKDLHHSKPERVCNGPVLLCHACISSKYAPSSASKWRPRIIDDMECQESCYFLPNAPFPNTSWTICKC